MSVCNAHTHQVICWQVLSSSVWWPFVETLLHKINDAVCTKVQFYRISYRKTSPWIWPSTSFLKICLHLFLFQGRPAHGFDTQPGPPQDHPLPHDSPLPQWGRIMRVWGAYNCPCHSDKKCGFVWVTSYLLKATMHWHSFQFTIYINITYISK